jgi:hypothetical protein
MMGWNVARLLLFHVRGKILNYKRRVRKDEAVAFLGD